MTPSRASQVGQESTDTYNRAWRTRGAPHARRTLQRETEEAAQAPQSLGVSAAFLPAPTAGGGWQSRAVLADVKPFVQFIQSSNKHLLSSYYAPGISPGAGDRAINQT